MRSQSGRDDSAVARLDGTQACHPTQSVITPTPVILSEVEGPPEQGTHSLSLCQLDEIPPKHGITVKNLDGAQSLVSQTKAPPPPHHPSQQSPPASYHQYKYHQSVTPDPTQH